MVTRVEQGVNSEIEVGVALNAEQRAHSVRRTLMSVVGAYRRQMIQF
jgi:hypothetical protein